MDKITKGIGICIIALVWVLIIAPAIILMLEASGYAVSDAARVIFEFLPGLFIALLGVAKILGAIGA